MNKHAGTDCLTHSPPFASRSRVKSEEEEEL